MNTSKSDNILALIIVGGVLLALLESAFIGAAYLVAIIFTAEPTWVEVAVIWCIIQVILLAIGLAKYSLKK